MSAQVFTGGASSEAPNNSPLMDIVLWLATAIVIGGLILTLAAQDWEEIFSAATTGRVSVRNQKEIPINAEPMFQLSWMICRQDPTNPGQSWLTFQDEVVKLIFWINRPCSSLNPSGSANRKPEHNKLLLCSVLRVIEKELPDTVFGKYLVVALRFSLSCR